MYHAHLSLSQLSKVTLTLNEISGLDCKAQYSFLFSPTQLLHMHMTTKTKYISFSKVENIKGKHIVKSESEKGKPKQRSIQ